ncbi:hypothetical protein LSTR_LSTR005439 [Laodelphax striatellus]|uniref:Set2 Rpb1 interacting domain-containing protein n=1 Tax=Laodelphax striatellus TaxID=195883 RepID=A0A482WWE3_LAOST|nr:hypothetical protein LSTR_LSTR005439 [Laodelphax striatellus]
MGIEQNEYEDFTCIKNFVFHSDIEDDESGDDKKLTSLVRESYVKRLRQLLKQNYKVWCENYKDESVSGDGKRLSSTEIDRCITFLEDKALQVCMVARIYQKVMVKTMTDIKKSTREMKLFESLVDTKGWNVDRYPDKCTQTETAPKCDSENQTDPVAFGPRYSLLDLPLPSVNSMTSCLEVKISTPDSPCKQLKETVAKVMPRVINRSQEGSSQTRKRRRSSASLDVNCDQNIKMAKRDSIDSFCNNLSSSEVSVNVLDVSNKTMISDASLNGDSCLVDRIDTNETDDNLLSLDERLMEMGLLNIEEQSGDEQSMAPSPNPGTRGQRVHKGTWYVEMVAHVCNFHRAYNQLTPEQSARIDLKIAKLFGNRSYDRSVKLSDDNLSLCRKRIASRVVAELTPYLDKKLIYNRLLFKEFAKRVTECIMEESYAPESSRIKNFVVDFFDRNKSIKSMIDIEFCRKEICL